MKKLTTYILVAFLSMSVASPAFSDINCGYIKKQVLDEIEFLKLLNFSLERQIKEKNYDDAYQATGNLKKEVQQSLNSYANIWTAFCK